MQQSANPMDDLLNLTSRVHKMFGRLSTVKPLLCLLAQSFVFICIMLLIPFDLVICPRDLSSEQVDYGIGSPFRLRYLVKMYLYLHV